MIVLRRHYRVVSCLVKEYEGPQFLCCFPERQKLQFVQGASVDMIVDHCSLETQLAHCPFQFSYGSFYILHWQRSQASEPLRPGFSKLRHVVVAILGGRGTYPQGKAVV